MNKKYLSSIRKETGTFKSIVKVEYINEKLTTTNKTYFEILLKDKSGTGKSNIFQDTIDFKNGDVLEINSSYDKQWKNYKISKILILKDGEYDEDDLGKVYIENINNVIEEIYQYTEQIQNQFLKDILNHFYKDDKFLNKMKSIPDTLFSNQNYNGGTLEKHLRLVKTSLFLSENYKNNYDKIDNDLLIAGSLLISISKNIEFDIKLDSDGNEDVFQTDIGILVDSSKTSLYKVMEIGKDIINKSITKLKELKEEIFDNEYHIKNLKDNIENLNDGDLELKNDFEKNIKQIDNELFKNNDLYKSMKNDLSINNNILIKVIHIISSQGFYFHHKSERENFPKFIEAQIISLSVHNNFNLSTFLNEFNNLKNIDSEDNHIYSNKLNNNIYIK